MASTLQSKGNLSRQPLRCFFLLSIYLGRGVQISANKKSTYRAFSKKNLGANYGLLGYLSAQFIYPWLISGVNRFNLSKNDAFDAMAMYQRGKGGLPLDT